MLLNESLLRRRNHQSGCSCERRVIFLHQSAGQLQLNVLPAAATIRCDVSFANAAGGNNARESRIRLLLMMMKETDQPSE